MCGAFDQMEQSVTLVLKQGTFAWYARQDRLFLCDRFARSWELGDVPQTAPLTVRQPLVLYSSGLPSCFKTYPLNYY